MCRVMRDLCRAKFIICVCYPHTAQRNDLLFAVTNTTTFPGYGYFLEQVHAHPRLHHAHTLCPLIQTPSHPILPPCPRATHHGPRIGTHRKKQTGFCLRCTVATTGSVCGSSRALLVLLSTPPLTPPCPFARRLRRVTSRGHQALGMCAVCQCIF